MIGIAACLVSAAMTNLLPAYIFTDQHHYHSMYAFGLAIETTYAIARLIQFAEPYCALRILATIGMAKQYSGMHEAF